MRNKNDGCYVAVAISARGALACALGGAAAVAAAVLFGPEALLVAAGVVVVIGGLAWAFGSSGPVIVRA